MKRFKAFSLASLMLMGAITITGCGGTPSKTDGDMPLTTIKEKSDTKDVNTADKKAVSEKNDLSFKPVLSGDKLPGTGADPISLMALSLALGAFAARKKM